MRNAEKDELSTSLEQGCFLLSHGMSIQRAGFQLVDFDAILFMKLSSEQVIGWDGHVSRGRACLSGVIPRFKTWDDLAGKFLVDG
jgi:hypothetical protein